MHHRELLELAALLGSHSTTIVRTVKRLSDKSIGGYWSASKFRQERWRRSIKKYSHDVQDPNGDHREQSWARVRPVLEEILASEVLTRIWTAIVVAHNRLYPSQDIEPIAHSVFTGHLDARARALNLMVYGQGFGVEEAVELNRLRRRTERWTDLLLGQLVGSVNLKPYAFDAKRCQEFSTDIGPTSRHGQFAWELVVASMRAAFETGLSESCPNSDLNQKIAESIFVCLPQDLFGSTGLMKSLWLVRMECMTDDAQVMIDQYLATYEPDENTTTKTDRFSSRQHPQ